MKTTIIFFLFTAWFDLSPSQVLEAPNDQSSYYADPQIKLDAFMVLNAKCNTCHRKQNPTKVFTMDNMEKLSPKIHTQVFVKERMPKGKDNALSPQESQTIRTWLTSLNTL